MSFNVQSSAIDNISDVENGQVSITFNGGREYVYQVADPDTFVSDLNNVIEENESVGRFINQAIRSQHLNLSQAAAE